MMSNKANEIKSAADTGMMIRMLRRKAGMTQAELAKKVNQSPSSITMYETGRRAISLEMMETFADVFNVPLLILGYDPEKPPDAFNQNGLFDDSMDEDTRTLATGFEKMPQEQKQKLKDFLGEFFSEYFDEFKKRGNDDDHDA